MAAAAGRVVDNAYPGTPSSGDISSDEDYVPQERPLPEEAVKILKGAVWQGTYCLSDAASLTRFKLGGALWLLLQGAGRRIQAKAKVPLTRYHDALKTIDLICDDKQEWVLARCDLSCIYRDDAWYTAACAQGMMVGSPQEAGLICPCCQRSSWDDDYDICHP